MLGPPSGCGADVSRPQTSFPRPKSASKKLLYQRVTGDVNDVHGCGDGGLSTFCRRSAAEGGLPALPSLPSLHVFGPSHRILGRHFELQSLPPTCWQVLHHRAQRQLISSAAGVVGGALAKWPTHLCTSRHTRLHNQSRNQKNGASSKIGALSTLLRARIQLVEFRASHGRPPHSTPPYFQGHARDDALPLLGDGASPITGRHLEAAAEGTQSGQHRGSLAGESAKESIC